MAHIVTRIAPAGRGQLCGLIALAQLAAAEASFAIALAAIPKRANYQRGILRGSYRLSGSDLRGRAQRYAGRYRRSADAAIERAISAGAEIGETTMGHGHRRVLTYAGLPVTWEI